MFNFYLLLVFSYNHQLIRFVSNNHATRPLGSKKDFKNGELGHIFQ